MLVRIQLRKGDIILGISMQDGSLLTSQLQNILREIWTKMGWGGVSGQGGNRHIL